MLGVHPLTAFGGDLNIIFVELTAVDLHDDRSIAGVHFKLRDILFPRDLRMGLYFHPRFERIALGADLAERARGVDEVTLVNEPGFERGESPLIFLSDLSRRQLRVDRDLTRLCSKRQSSHRVPRSVLGGTLESWISLAVIIPS
jgi:hypothetical protein